MCVEYSFNTGTYESLEQRSVQHMVLANIWKQGVQIEVL